MKDKLIDVFLFLALTFGLIAFVMGVVALFADMRATASVAPTAETEGAAQRDDVGIVPYGEASYRQVTQTPAANVSDDHEREADADQQVSFDEQGYLSFCTWREIEMLACLIDWEIGAGTRNEKAAIAWEVLNRIDSTDYDFRNIHTISQALYQHHQYYSSYSVGSQESTEIVIEVLTLYMMEQQSGYPIEGRVLPREYRWHSGDYVAHNYFRDAYQAPYTIWDWRWTGGY